MLLAVTCRLRSQFVLSCFRCFRYCPVLCAFPFVAMFLMFSLGCACRNLFLCLHSSALDCHFRVRFYRNVQELVFASHAPLSRPFFLPVVFCVQACEARFYHMLSMASLFDHATPPVIGESIDFKPPPHLQVATRGRTRFSDVVVFCLLFVPVICLSENCECFALLVFVLVDMTSLENRLFDFIACCLLFLS